MRLPSLQRMLTGAVRVGQRFPLTLLCAAVLGGVGIYLTHLDYPEKEGLRWVFPVLSTAGLGLSLTLAVALVAERRRWRAPGRGLAQAGAVALLAGWYALAPAEPDVTWALRVALLALGLHLAVAAGPYLGELRRGADTPGFWRYNETLFLRILTAALYSGVLYAGCALALLAIGNLFDVELNRKVYPDLFLVLATVFNTWFFLAGVPEDFEALETDAATYPKGLQLFTQFVLLPLVVLYLGILYAYLARIVGRWTLPQGWVSVLVLALAVAGIFALLLIHPIRNSADNAWIRTFSRWFYRALFPLLALLAVAIGTRIQAYGLTEERYFVLVLAAWLFGMAVYFLRRRGQGIIWIPASLALVALLAAAGPWGAFAVARRSQLNQLRELGARYHLLKDGRLDGAGQRVPRLPLAARQRFTSILEFFTERDAATELQPFFTASLLLPDSLRNQAAYRRKLWVSDRLFALSGIERANRYETEQDSSLVAEFFTPRNDNVYELDRGRYWFEEIHCSEYGEMPADSVLATATGSTGAFRLRVRYRGRLLQLEQRQPDGAWQPRLTTSPGALTDSLTRVHSRNPGRSIELPATGLALQARDKSLTLHLFFRELSRQEKQGQVSTYFRAQALLEATP